MYMVLICELCIYVNIYSVILQFEQGVCFDQCVLLAKLY